MRRTSNQAIALERAAALVDGTVRPGDKRGHREVVLPRNGRGDVHVQGRTAHCLYTVVLALTEPPERGGYGLDWDDVRDGVRFVGRPKASKGHEVNLLRNLVWQP